MIELKELQNKISSILNGLDSSTSVYDNPCDDFYFAVKTYGTRLETIADSNLKRNVIPVYINGVSGNIEPIEDLNEVDSSFDIYIYFPLKYKEQFFKLSNFLLSALNAKTYNYGTISGNAFSTLSIPELDEIQDLQLNELSSFIQEDYNLSINKTEQWGLLSFTLYFYQVANLGEENGYILGNEVKYYLTYKNLTEEITATQRIVNYEGDTYSEQNFAENETGTIVKNGLTTWTINPYIKNNTFWKTFLYDFENGDLYNQTVILKTVYPFATYQRQLLISNCVSVDELGELKAVTLTLTKKIGVSETITTYYTLNLKYYINNVEDTSLSNSTQIESGTRVYPSNYAKNISSYMIDSYTPNTSFVMNNDNSIYYYYVDAVLSEPTISNGVMRYQGKIVNTLAVPVVDDGIMHYQGELPNYITSLTLALDSTSVVSGSSVTYTISYTPTDAINNIVVSSSNSDFTIDSSTSTITTPEGEDATTTITATDTYTGLSTSKTLSCNAVYETHTVTCNYVKRFSDGTYETYTTETHTFRFKTGLNPTVTPSNYVKDIDGFDYAYSSPSSSFTLTADTEINYFYDEEEELNSPLVSGSVSCTATSSSDYELYSSSGTGTATATATYRYEGSTSDISITSGYIRIYNNNDVAVSYTLSGSETDSGTISANSSVVIDLVNAVTGYTFYYTVTFSASGYSDRSTAGSFSDRTITKSITLPTNGYGTCSSGVCSNVGEVTGDTDYCSYTLSNGTDYCCSTTSTCIQIAGCPITFETVTWDDTL